MENGASQVFKALAKQETTVKTTPNVLTIAQPNGAEIDSIYLVYQSIFSLIIFKR